MGLSDREDPRVAERLREVMSPLDLGGRAVAPLGAAGLDAARDTVPDAALDDQPATRHWLHTTWGRWALRIAAAVGFLVLGAWYGMSAARRVAVELTPRPGSLGALVDPAFRGPDGRVNDAGARAVKRATDAYVAELIRLELTKELMTPAQRTAATAAARAKLVSDLEQLSLKSPE